MAQQPIASAPARRFGLRSIGWWLLVVVSFGLLALLIIQLVIRFSTPPPPHRLQAVQDVPLPDALPDRNRTPQNPLAPGKAERFDFFDFQALDPQTHLLFIVHTGPNPVKSKAVDHNFDPNTDGNVIVFDTQQNKVVGLVDVPHQGAGVAVAPDLGRAYVADNLHGIVYVIDEKTLKTTQIKLAPNDGPDDIEYDQVDHKIFVSDMGIPPNDTTMIPDRQNQNLAVIDALTNTLVTKIPLGNDGSRFGDNVGHNWFDPVSHQEFVVRYPLSDLNSPNPAVMAAKPPSFLTVINPITAGVVTSIRLPDACVNPHGLTVDGDQHEAFVACIDTQNLVRVDLQTMRPFPDATLQRLTFRANVLRLDPISHLLFAGCGVGIPIFDESRRELKPLGIFFLGGGSHHTIALNPAKQTLYLPLVNVGGRPVMRVVHYIPNCPQCMMP